MAKIVAIGFAEDEDAELFVRQMSDGGYVPGGQVVAVATSLIGFSMYGPGVRRHSDDRSSGSAELHEPA